MLLLHDQVLYVMHAAALTTWWLHIIRAAALVTHCEQNRSTHGMKPGFDQHHSIWDTKPLVCCCQTGQMQPNGSICVFTLASDYDMYGRHMPVLFSQHQLKHGRTHTSLQALVTNVTDNEEHNGLLRLVMIL